MSQSEHMSQSDSHQPFSKDLQEVADVLRERRSALKPLELDRIKLRAMSSARRSTTSSTKGFSMRSRLKGYSMRSRLIAFLTAGMLVVGSGSAMADFFNWGGGFGGYFDFGGSASYHQYRPPCKDGYGFGDDHHCHIGPPGQHHHFHFIHGFCWISDGHGGYNWGYGDGWVDQ